MNMDEFRKRMLTRTGLESLTAHLEHRYGIQVAGLSKLDLDVFRVKRTDGPDWVARLFPAARPLENVVGDADILRFLAEWNFPAERCAHSDAVTEHEGQGVLVTEYVDGFSPKGGPRVFQVLGSLLGRLSALSAETGAPARRGGAWHHLCLQGGSLAEEIEAARRLLADAEPGISAKQRTMFRTLCDKLDRCDDFGDLPQSFLHPDLVPKNTIAWKEGGGAVIDWTGAGRGPRIWPLGFLLFAAGRRDLQRVDAVVEGYRKHVRLQAAELQRLSAAIRIRPLIFDCWAFGTGRKKLPEIVQGLAGASEFAEAVAERAALAFENSGESLAAAPEAEPTHRPEEPSG